MNLSYLSAAIITMLKRLGILLVVIVFFSGCEDVIEVETPTEPPRLIVNGILRVDENEPFIPVEIRVSQTDNFFGETTVASLESIAIFIEAFDETGATIGSGTSNLTELDEGSGIYVPDPSFSTDQRISTAVLALDPLFTLVITYNGRRYAAQTRYAPAAPIDRIVQGTETLFDDDTTEVIVSFTDDETRDNFYVFDFGLGAFSVTEDQFYQGESFEFSYFYDRELTPGEEITVSILGADQGFYNYMDLLIEQTENNLGVFETPAATARGNVFDITGLDNINVVDNTDRPFDFPLGYFAIVESFSETITIE